MYEQAGIFSVYINDNRINQNLSEITFTALSLIALSEKDAFIEGFKLGVRMTTEIYADTQQRG